MSEYIKKEPIAKEIKQVEDFWRKKWKDYDSTAKFEDAHIAKAVMNAYKYLGLFLSDLPTYSFPDREWNYKNVKEWANEHNIVLVNDKWYEKAHNVLELNSFPVREKGEWEYTGVSYCEEGMTRYIYRCSRCGYEGTDNEFMFCPCCGADMRGKAE